MIRIARPKRVPSVLRTRGEESQRNHCDEFDAGREAFTSGKRSFAFKRDVYADRSVKRSLVKAQHEKCAFCESKVTHVASGDVEHFRPKAASRQADDGPLLRPGYYWLAYTWENLLFACEECNRRHKRNFFPLADATKRARTPACKLDDEQPLFIDPAREDPTDHIGFREEYPFGRTPRGEATWMALGLDREPLAARRREKLRRLQVLQDAMRALNDVPKTAALRARIQTFLDQAAAADGEYAAMVRAELDRVSSE